MESVQFENLLERNYFSTQNESRVLTFCLELLAQFVDNPNQGDITPNIH